MYSASPRSDSRLFLLAVLVCGWSVAASAQRTKPTPSPKPASPTPTATPTPSPSSSYALPDPVATVNGQPISKGELEHFTEMYMNAGGRSLKSYQAADQKKAYRAMLANLIVDRLVSAQAVNEPVSDTDVEKRLDEVRSQYPNNDAFQNEVRRSGQTLDQVRQSIHSQLAREQWTENQIKDQVNVTPPEVDKFYADGPPNKFDEPEKVSASHILIGVRRDAPPEEALAAEKRANDIEDRLKKGENFEDLAVQLSTDPTAKKNKGYVGSFSKEGIMPEFADAAFKLKPGEISPPVRTQFGYHIIKVTDRKPAHTQTIEEARDRIRTYIEDQKRQKATLALVARLRDAAKIDVAADLREESHSPALATPQPSR